MMENNIGWGVMVKVCYVLILSLCSGIGVAKEELWFGSYVDDNGQLLQGRYHVGFEGESEQIVSLQLAPYGKPTTDFKITEHDLKSGFLSAEWSGTNKKINFFRYSPSYYSGNWISGTKVQPMVLKRFNGQDAERQGNWFKASTTEIAIIDHAKQLLRDNSRWDKNDDRICTSNSTYSVFCALYHASVTVDGEYRHLRPAIKAVREAIEQSHPKKYDHVLVDFNNSKNTSVAEIHHIFNQAQELLKLQMKNRQTND